jgi:hypothetical protein
MEEDRIARAVSRIEAAAGRIEAAGSPAAGGTGDPQLAREHEALRHEAGAALAELDRLIGSLGG